MQPAQAPQIAAIPFCATHAAATARRATRRCSARCTSRNDRPRRPDRRLARAPWRRRPRERSKKPALVAQQRREGRDHLRVSERSVKGALHDSARIDDDRRRQSERGVHASVSLFSIDEKRIMDAERLRECSYARGGLTLIHAEHDYVARGVRLIQSLKIRHFRSARRTPGCPKIHHDDASAVSIEPRRAAAQACDRKLGAARPCSAAGPDASPPPCERKTCSRTTAAMTANAIQ